MPGDYVPQFTARLFVDYVTLGRVHTNIFRMPRGTGPEDTSPFMEQVERFYSETSGFRFTDWTIQQVRFSEADQLISLPIAHSINPVPGTQVIPALVTEAVRSFVIAFTARSAFGGPAAVYVYGIQLGLASGVTGDFRVTTAEHTAVANAVGQLNSAPGFVGNDNGELFWRSYMLVKTNDYWRKQAL